MTSLQDVRIEYKGKTISIDAVNVKSARAGAAQGRISFSSVSTDTRTIEPGALFVALVGEKLDGHEYLAAAAQKGASCMLIEKDIEGFLALAEEYPDVIFIQVGSTHAVLQDMARQYRSRLDIPVIGVTGSNGKTTTKNLIASVLSQKFKVASTKGNLNNHIGLPLSVLSIDPEDQIAVFEAGINHVGEMSLLSSIMKPTTVVITNIGSAHIEYFGTKDSIAREKALLGEFAPDGADVIVPAGEPYADAIAETVGHLNVRHAGEGEGASFAAKAMRILKDNSFKYADAAHVMADGLLAIEIGRMQGLTEEEAAQGVLTAKLESGRFDIHAVADSLTVIDDTYNANPDSVCASLEAMRSMHPDGSLVLVLGSLKEQGDFLGDGYRKILEKAAQLYVDEVFLVEVHSSDVAPSKMRLPRTHYFSSKQLCIDVLTTFLEEKVSRASGTKGVGSRKGAKDMAGKDTGIHNTVVLVKGSRSARMEDVVKEIVSIK